jgi:hypothetical protein
MATAKMWLLLVENDVFGIREYMFQYLHYLLGSVFGIRKLNKPAFRA